MCVCVWRTVTRRHTHTKDHSLTELSSVRGVLYVARRHTHTKDHSLTELSSVRGVLYVARRHTQLLSAWSFQNQHSCRPDPNPPRNDRHGGETTGQGRAGPEQILRGLQSHTMLPVSISGRRANWPAYASAIYILWLRSRFVNLKCPWHRTTSIPLSLTLSRTVANAHK